MKKKRSQRKKEPNRGRGGFIWQFFRWNYRRTLIVVGGIKFRRKLIKMRTKKVRKSRQTFQSVGICADGHVSDMRALRDVRKFVGDSVGDCGTIP